MARLRKQLGADGMKFNIVFVSVNPGRDRPADLESYVALFGTPIIGLSGTKAQIDQIKRDYRVYSAKVAQPGGDYTIDHTAAIYLMDADGGSRLSGIRGDRAGQAQAADSLTVIPVRRSRRTGIITG